MFEDLNLISMIIGIPKEIKPFEYRVGLIPSTVKALTSAGHAVFVEQTAGLGSGFLDEDYLEAGAVILKNPNELYARSETIIKVKEPQPSEMAFLRPGLMLFCFFHFAGSECLTKSCLDKRITALAFETLFDANHRLPILAPMSEIAGRLSVQEGAKCLENPMHGRGLLLGGVPGVERGEVLILGGGMVGENAARIAAGFGANVTILDINPQRMHDLESILPPNVKTQYNSDSALKSLVTKADLVIGAALIPGKKAPKLISQEMLKTMKKGSVLVDVSIDQGGCFETSHSTTHDEPTYIVDDVVHYAVANMPGAVSRTSTLALNQVLLPYAVDLANLGVDGFLALSHGHQNALNMRDGKLSLTALKETFPNLC